MTLTGDALIERIISLKRKFFEISRNLLVHYISFWLLTISVLYIHKILYSPVPNF